MITVRRLVVPSHRRRGTVTSLGLRVESRSEANGSAACDGVTSSSRRRYATNKETADAPSTQDGLPLKPFSQIPGPKGLPIIGTLWDYIKSDGFKVEKIFEVMRLRANEFGPIYKETIAKQTTVTISNLDEYAKVIKVDGKYPIRNELPPLAHYQRKKNISLGLLNSQGEEWHKYRSILIRRMLTLSEVQEYIEPQDRIATDFITRLRHVQAMSRDFVIQDLENEVFKWTLESIGCVLFDERLGCLIEPVPQHAQEFTENVRMYFKYMYQLMHGLPTYKLYPTKTWKTFEKHANKVYELGQKYVDKKLEALRKQTTRSSEEGEREEKKLTFLPYLLSQANLTPREVNSACIELLNGGVETTARGLLWTLYCLAKNPEIQDVLFREIENVLPGRTSVTVDALQRLSYVKACQKESFRLYPVAFSTIRTIAKDIECFGYHIPAGTVCGTNLYAIGRSESWFPDPQRFQPERWLRGEKEESRQRTFSNLLFGHGPRMCIGRRFAEQELYIAIAKIIQNFRLEYHAEDVEPVFHMALAADRPLKITFIPRD